MTWRTPIATVLFLATFTAGAQQYFFRNYSTGSGLPFVQVFCMYQDADGYLWSGGYGGLSRFDGKVFTNYNRKNGLIDHHVNAICSDGRGAVFAGTNKGLSVLRAGRFTNHDAFGDYQRPLVTSLSNGFAGDVYIGTPRGLFNYDEGEVSQVQQFHDVAVNDVKMYDTALVIAGTDKGLVLYGAKTFSVIGVEQGLASARVNCVARYGKFIACGTPAGLSLYEPGTGRVTNFGVAHGLRDAQVTALFSEAGRYLWIGSNEGLTRFDGERFEFYTVSDENNANLIRCIIGDREKNIWIGTHSGLFRYRDNAFATYRENGLANAFVFQIFRDRSGDLWVTTQNRGVFRQRNGQFERFGETHGLGGSVCRSGLQDRSGRLLFGAGPRLVQFVNGRFMPIVLPQSFEGDIDVMHEARDGSIWLGGANGVCRLRFRGGVPASTFYPIDSDEPFAVYGFCEDDSGRVYAGTFKAGLHRLEGDSFVNISTRFRLNEETFFMLRYTNGLVFAASLNGVLVLDVRTGHLRRISDIDGLNSELVYSLEFTRDRKYMWIGTNQGINRLDLNRYLADSVIAIRSFGLQEGFTGVECNGNGIWEDDDGTLWFGTVSGLVRHQPFSYKENDVPAKTVLQTIQVVNEDTLVRDSITLPSHMNTVAFYYRGICLTNPDKVLYQRRLLGLQQEEEWSPPSADNSIKYTNLAPGRYSFQLRSSNNEGVWNTRPTTFSFTVRPPFYLTWWFLSLSAFVLFASVYLAFMLRIYYIKKKQRIELERRVEMSKIELKALRSQMNPHFIFNSLNSIQHYIFHARSEEAIRYLNKFARLVRVILNNSEKPTVTVGEDIEALKLYLELEQMRFEDKFDYEVIVDESVDPDYDIMPPLLMQPYVENAILHGLNPKPVKGRLTIRLHSKNNFLICTITDNGIGRERAAEIRRTMPVNKHRSMGMKITEDRLRILNDASNSKLSVSIIDLKDERGEAAGTQVEIYVPLGG